jgi:hypothetical protein
MKFENRQKKYDNGSVGSGVIDWEGQKEPSRWRRRILP